MVLSRVSDLAFIVTIVIILLFIFVVSSGTLPERTPQIPPPREVPPRAPSGFKSTKAFRRMPVWLVAPSAGCRSSITGIPAFRMRISIRWPGSWPSGPWGVPASLGAMEESMVPRQTSLRRAVFPMRPRRRDLPRPKWTLITYGRCSDEWALMTKKSSS